MARGGSSAVAASPRLPPTQRNAVSKATSARPRCHVDVRAFRGQVVRAALRVGLRHAVDDAALARAPPHERDDRVPDLRRIPIEPASDSPRPCPRHAAHILKVDSRAVPDVVVRAVAKVAALEPQIRPVRGRPVREGRRRDPQRRPDVALARRRGRGRQRHERHARVPRSQVAQPPVVGPEVVAPLRDAVPAPRPVRGTRGVAVFAESPRCTESPRCSRGAAATRLD